MDVRVVCTTRHDDETYQRLSLKRATDAEKDGRRLSTFVEKLGFSQLELNRRLRGRSHKIDLQLDMHKPRELPPGATVLEVYRRPGT